MFLICKFPNIKLQLINFATNFRQAENINVEISDIVTTASLFNESNYKLSAVDNNKEIKEETKVEAKKSSVIALLCLIIIYIYLFIAKKVER